MGKNSRALTARQARMFDIKAREAWGLSTLALMENAGGAVAEEAVKLAPGRKAIAIFCGKGNNGGDGFVASRHLLSKGFKPDIFLAGNISGVGNEAGINLGILLKLKQRVLEVDEHNLNLVRNKIQKYGLIIDALLGVGLTGEVRGIYRDLIGLINISKARILSIDIPSGLDATSGKILGCCINANETVTFLAKKRGMVAGRGAKYCGKVVVRGLGIPY